MATLQLDRLTKRFAETAAVDQVSLAIGDGELVCLLGPSGCGKSTVLRMIGGFETPSDGRVAIDGADIGTLPPNRRPTGMVFQSHALWPHMTVSRNIAFGLRLRPLSRGEVDRRVDGVLELVGLTGYGGRYPGQLSGGQQQRVAIARCVVLEPKILLMDEPFSALDAHLRVRLREEVRAIQRRLGLTTVFVTHDQEEAMTLADRIVVMKDGRIEQVGRPGEIYARPETEFVAGFIGTMTLAEARVEAGRLRWQGLAAPCDLPDGPATLALRPEDLVPVPAGTPNAVSGRVARLVDLGAVRMADVDIGGGAVLKLQLGRADGIAEGTAVSLRPTRCALFRAGEPARHLTLVDPPGNRSKPMPDGIEIVADGHRTRLKWHRLQRRPDDIPFTPARLREGMALGASMEVDLRRRADGGFACLHDDTLDRETTGHGPVAAAGFGDLRALRMRGKDGTPTEERLLLLEDLAELAAAGAGPATLVQLDLKEADAALDGRSVDAFRVALAPVAGRFILSGGDWAAVRRLGAAVLRLGFDPCDDDTLGTLVTAADAERFIAAALDRAPEATMIYLSYPIVLRADALGVDLIAACHAAGKSVDAWTLNPDHPDAAASLARLVALRADQITTDAAGVLQAMFGSPPVRSPTSHG